MLHYVLRLHVHLLQMSVLQQITKVRFVMSYVELIFCRVLTGRDKNNCLIETLKRLYLLFATKHPFSQLLDSLSLLGRSLEMTLRDRRACLG